MKVVYVFFFLLNFITIFYTNNAMGTSNENLTFSNTQKWGDEEMKFLKSWKYRLLSYSKTDQKNYLANPKNSSAETKKELKQLLKYQIKRTAKQEALIEREKHVCGFKIATYQVGQIPEIDQLIYDIYFDARLVGFKLKKYFNRVRPSFLSKDLRPSIDNPPHPAYPSNHTLQSTIIAKVLGDIFILEKENFAKAALAIGVNREIAGVHYPSDTILGQNIANNIHRELLSSKKYLSIIKVLKKKYATIKNIDENFSDRIQRKCFARIYSYASKNKIAH